MPQRITGHTELIGLIATPIRHSKSPMMHNTAFEALGLDYAYLAFDFQPDRLEDAVKGLKALGAKGWNVSMPYKTDIIPLLDEISEVSRLCESVNTVINRDGKLYGTPAVIDKDFASAKLAELLDADMLVILTAVEKVAINFGKPDQKGLDTLTPDEARKYIDEKQFAPGSMLPKVQAAMSFAESKPGRVALITLLEKAAEGIEGKTGTRVQM